MPTEGAAGAEGADGSGWMEVTFEPGDDGSVMLSLGSGVLFSIVMGGGGMLDENSSCQGWFVRLNSGGGGNGW